MTPLRLPRALFEDLLEEARRALPNECCGLLAGRGRTVSRVFRASNAQPSPSSYKIRPRELFALFRQMRAENLELVGIYHSHPAGENYPSARDRARAYYPDAAYVIVSLRAGAPQPLRAFRLAEESVEEIPVEIAD